MRASSAEEDLVEVQAAEDKSGREKEIVKYVNM